MRIFNVALIKELLQEVSLIDSLLSRLSIFLVMGLITLPLGLTLKLFRRRNVRNVSTSSNLNKCGQRILDVRSWWDNCGMEMVVIGITVFKLCRGWMNISRSI